MVLTFFLSITASLMIFNIINVKASTDLDPDPDELEFYDGYWDFDEGDIFGWEVKRYKDDVLVEVEPFIFNVSSITYEEVFGTMGYKVDFKRMYWENDTNQLEEREDGDYEEREGWNMYNFTKYNIKCGGILEKYMIFRDKVYTPFHERNYTSIPLVVPKNNTGDLPMVWFAEAYRNTLYDELDIWVTDIFIDTDNNETKFTISAESYVRFIYDGHGVLEIAEYKNGIEKINITRTTDFCPVDDIVWSVKKGETFYFGPIPDEYKIDIVDIINMTSNEESYQILAANISLWNSATEEWDLKGTWEHDETAAAMANEYEQRCIFFLPKGTTGEVLARRFIDIWYEYQDANCNFNFPEYGDSWLYLENPDTGEFCNYTFFSEGENEGVLKYVYDGFEKEHYHDYDDSYFGFSRGDQFIYNISILNETALDYFFYNWTEENFFHHNLNLEHANELGFKQKIEVWDIEVDGDIEQKEEGDGWEVRFELWEWVEDEEEWDWDSSYYGEQWIESNSSYADELPMWFSIMPVQNYINEIDVDKLEEWDWFNVEIDKVYASSNDKKNTFNISITYNPLLGVVDTFQIMNETGVYYEIELIDYIPKAEVPDYPTSLIYWKNTTDWDIGVHNKEYSFGADFNFKIDLELNHSAQVSFTPFCENPIPEDPLIDSIVYFDLFISNSSAIEFPINMTIEIPASIENVEIFFYNDTLEEWVEIVDYSKVGNIITMQLDHASIFSITETGGSGTPSGPDSYEPNNDFDSATPLILDGSGNPLEQLTIDPAGDVDFFKIHLNQGDDIDILLWNLPANYDLALFFPDRTLIAESTNPGTMDDQILYNDASVSGDYYIRVSDAQGYAGIYNLTIDITPTDDDDDDDDDDDGGGGGGDDGGSSGGGDNIIGGMVSFLLSPIGLIAIGGSTVAGVAVVAVVWYFTKRKKR